MTDLGTIHTRIALHRDCVRRRPIAPLPDPEPVCLLNQFAIAFTMAALVVYPLHQSAAVGCAFAGIGLGIMVLFEALVRATDEEDWAV